MNRQCKNCGKSVAQDMKFCPLCGCSEFVLTNVQQENPGTPYVNRTIPDPYADTPTNPMEWKPPVQQNQPSKKKKNPWIIVVIILVIIIIGLAIWIFADDDKSDNNETTTTENQISTTDNSTTANNDIYEEEDDLYSESPASTTTNTPAPTTTTKPSTTKPSTTKPSTTKPSKVSYTKGTFDGTTYVNEWAGIQVDMPVGFSDSASEMNNLTDDLNTDYGIYWQSADSSKTFFISFEKLPLLYSNYDEEDYIEIVVTGLEAQYESYGITITSDENTNSTIAGKTYLKCSCYCSTDSVSFVQDFYVRKVDGYMICIAATGATSSVNDSFVKSITTVK